MREEAKERATAAVALEFPDRPGRRKSLSDLLQIEPDSLTEG